jgi:hypothetical protein
MNVELQYEYPKGETCENSSAWRDNIQIDSAGSLLSPFAGICEYTEEYLCLTGAGYVSIS